MQSDIAMIFDTDKWNLLLLIGSAPSVFWRRGIVLENSSNKSQRICSRPAFPGPRLPSAIFLLLHDQKVQHLRTVNARALFPCGLDNNAWKQSWLASRAQDTISMNICVSSGRRIDVQKSRVRGKESLSAFCVVVSEYLSLPYFQVTPSLPGSVHCLDACGTHDVLFSKQCGRSTLYTPFFSSYTFLSSCNDMSSMTLQGPSTCSHLVAPKSQEIGSFQPGNPGF